MTRYKVGVLARPLVLVMFPAILASGYWMQFIPLVVVMVGIATPAIWWARCLSCNASVYFDAKSPLKTLLAKPHKVCTKCGASNDG